MGTPKDWLRESRGIGTFSQPAALRDLPPEPYEQDPFAENERLRRAEHARRERDALFEEQEEEREMRRMAKQVKQLQLQRQLAQLNGEGPANGGVEVFREIVRELQEDKRLMLDELRQARTENANAVNRTLQEQLATLEKRIENVVVPRETEADPIGKLVRDLKAVHTVREALDDALPQRGPTEAQSRHERLEELRIDKEYQLRKMEAEGQIETARAQREAAQADRDMKVHRMNRASKLVEDTIGPVVAAIAGDKLGGMLGGDNKTEDQIAEAGYETLPYRCPNPDCQEVGYAPEGTLHTICSHCGAEFSLRPATPEEMGQAQPLRDDLSSFGDNIAP